MCGWQVKLCDPLVTRGPYLSDLEIRSLCIKRYINSPSLLLYFTVHKYEPSFSGCLRVDMKTRSCDKVAKEEHLDSMA